MTVGMMRQTSIIPKTLHSYNPIPWGCVLYLPMWAKDLSGPVFKSAESLRHDSVVIGASYAGVKLGRYYDVARNDKIACGVSPALNLTTDVTVIIWSNSEAFDVGNTIRQISKAKYELSIVAGSFLRWSLDLTGGVHHLDSGAGTVNAINTWYHLAGTYNRVNQVCYIDAVQANTRADNEALNDNAADILNIGNRQATDRGQNGWLGEAWVYNRALTVEELLYHRARTVGRYQ